MRETIGADMTPACEELLRAIQLEKNEKDRVVNLRRLVRSRTTIQPEYAYRLVKLFGKEMGIERRRIKSAVGSPLEIICDFKDAEKLCI